MRIEDYALLGDTQSAALVGRDGSIDWLCLPRFDSGACFASLLGDSRHGRWLLSPAGPVARTRRRYRPGTLILETDFDTEGGTVRLIDFMPLRDRNPDVVRIVEGLRGQVRVHMELVIRFDYGSIVPWVRTVDGVLRAVGGPDSLYLQTPVETRGEGLTTVADFVVSVGERVPFVLTWNPSHLPPVESTNPERALTETEEWWKDWSGRCTYKGPWREQVLRSLITLKALTYAPTGAIVAAPTTSLPESIGGVRNWDYRYCWLRDASWTVTALYDCGFANEGAAFLDWLLYSTRLTQPNLQMLYDVFGEANVPETTLDHLEGYRGSRPVRIGNAAHAQFQLDVYGEVLGAVEEATRRGERLDHDTQRLMRRLTDIVCLRWQEPDAGIWEKRGEPRQHVHGKVMAWSALDSAQRIAKRCHIEIDSARVEKAKADIKEAVMTRGFNARRNTFVGIFDEEDVDASLLFIARVGFIDPADPRMLGTIEAIRKDLGHDGLIYRYDSRKTDDGLPPGEGVFLPCSFWLVEALAMAGRVDEARTLFDDIVRRGNDVGLFAEEIDGHSGALMGNFPQALSHIALLNAALCVEEAAQKGKAEPRAQ